MIRVQKCEQAPKSLKSTRAYDGEDVKQQLLTDQHAKCYLCERILSTDFQIEHLRSQQHYILPNMDFSEIGWLTNPKQAESIISRTALDALQKELIDSFGLTDKGLGWSRNRDKFVRSIEQISVKQ